MPNRPTTKFFVTRRKRFDQSHNTIHQSIATEARKSTDEIMALDI